MIFSKNFIIYFFDDFTSNPSGENHDLNLKTYTIKVKRFLFLIDISDVKVN